MLFTILKGKKLTGEVLDELNYQFMRRLKKEKLITLKELYIDGTKIEANANRYTFVWRGSLRQRGKCGPCPGCVPSGWMCIPWMRRTVFTMRKYRKRIPVI